MLTHISTAKPDKRAGRVVLGPRLVGKRYARIVALADGSGQIEIFDADTERWTPALESCAFSDVWSAGALSPGVSTAMLIQRA